MNVVTSSVGSGLVQMAFSNGLIVLYSKDTPVAAQVPGVGTIQTENYYGNTFNGRIVSDRFFAELISSNF